MFDLFVYNMEKEPKKRESREVDVLVEDKEQIETPWRVLLYDDDIHTFDEVIGQLIKALNCSDSRAEELTFQVHNDGKANVYEGNFEACFDINSTLKEIQLITEIKG